MDLSYLAQIGFVAGAGLIAYVYFGYPVLVFILARLRPKPVGKSAIEPTVSFIITAFNEERAIRKKLENTLALDYPREKLEIIVASDCSSDATDEIVREFARDNVRLVRQMHRGGKTSAQNLAVEHATGEILHFSDATSAYPPNTLREMVANFADPSVGCVAGRLLYVDPERTDVGSGAQSYWGYETFIKDNESLACSLIGVSGCIYAVRRSSYVPMYPEACSDFLIASVVFKQGLRTVYEPQAVCIEHTNRQSGKEMRMRVRVIAQTFADLWRNRKMLDPFRSGFFAIQMVSHKLLRYCVPVFLMMVFFSSAVLAVSSTFFLSVFAVQALFYLAAIVAVMLERRGRRVGLLSIPLYFVLANAACVAGFFQFLRGERYAAWEPIRDSG